MNCQLKLYGHPDDVFHAGEPTLAELAEMLKRPLSGLLESDALPEEQKKY